MAAYDNKLLDGAGVAKLSQLIKEEIAQGGGSSYTAGAGIEIDSNNKIGQCVPIVYQLLGLSFGWTGMSAMSYASDAGLFIKKLEAGFPLFGRIEFSRSDLENYISGIYIVTSGGNISFAARYWSYPTDLTTADYYYVYLGKNGLAAKPRIAVSKDPAYFSQWGSKLLGYSGSLTATNLFDAITELDGKIPSIATTQAAGIVKPDGTTITIDSNGVISSQGGGGGGSSLPADPSTDGVYKLINTVETEGGVQTATQSWEEDTGGGGATYTGGLGIAIDSNNVINNETFDVAGLFQILTGLGRGTGESVFRQISRNSKNYLIESLKEQRPCYILGSGNSLSTTELYNLGFRAGVSYNRLTGERVQWGTYEVSGSSGPVPSQYSAVIPMGSFLFIATGDFTDFPIYGKLNLIPDMLYYNNTTSGLTSSTIKGAIDEVAASIATRIPPCPTTADGNYVLKCTVSSGTPTYSWVAEA